MVEDETGIENDINYISELKGQFFLNPILSITLTICLFSMAGIPPLIGFFSKPFVLYSAIQNGYYFMSIIAIIVSIITASYYLKIIKILYITDFQIQFYLFAMLFLIFDLEILLLFPIAVSLYKVSSFGFSIALIFFVVLTIGFILEIGSGAISIAKTTQTKFNK